MYKKWVLLDSRDKYRRAMTCSILERKLLWRHISKIRKANKLKFCMFTNIIHTIISTKFQINPLTVTLFSGSGPKDPSPLFSVSRPKSPPPPPRSWQNLKMPYGIGISNAGIVWYPYHCNDDKHWCFSWNTWNRYDDSFKILFGNILKTCSVDPYSYMETRLNSIWTGLFANLKAKCPPLLTWLFQVRWWWNLVRI